MKVVENHSQAVCSPLPPLRGKGDIPRCDGNVDFERLYKIYSRRVYALCFRLSRNTEDAEDLTQEAFLQVFRKIDTFRGESAFATWLYRLVLNVALMRLRKKRPLENPLEPDARSDHEAGMVQQTYGAPDAALIGAIDRVQLERAIAGLPPGYKVVFLLHDVEGYDHHEIAEILGWAQGTSKSQLHKARLKLRDLLSGAKPTGIATNGIGPRQKHPQVGMGIMVAPGNEVSGKKVLGWLYAPWRCKKAKTSRSVAPRRPDPVAPLPGRGRRQRATVSVPPGSERLIGGSTLKMPFEEAVHSSSSAIERSHATL